MTNLYEGKSVASMEMMTIEVACELINQQKIRIMLADVDKKHQALINNKLDELDEMDNKLYATEFAEILRIKQHLAKDIDDFLASLV